MWRLIYLLLGRGANQDTSQAYYTLQDLFEENAEDIVALRASLPEYEEGRYDYSELTWPQLKRAKNLRVRIFRKIGKLATRAGPHIGPIERMQVREFLLALPWIAFPPLSNTVIQRFGISQSERAVRLEVTEEEPRAYRPKHSTEDQTESLPWDRDSEADSEEDY